MEGYNVNLLPSAQLDILGIAEYLCMQGPESAEQHLDRVIEKVETLAVAPGNYPSAKDTQLRLRGYRVFPVNSHLMFFIIKGRSVEVRRVLYAKRKYESLFK